LPEAGILSIDARYHGGTTIDSISHEASEPELDLRLETLSSDLVFIVTETKLAMHWDMLPDLVLVGHSLGGAVITDVAKRGDLGSKILAYAVLDVVEGSDCKSYTSYKPFFWGGRGVIF
jgi:protein phosphatase methylesterase 1